MQSLAEVTVQLAIAGMRLEWEAVRRLADQGSVPARRVLGLP